MLDACNTLDAYTKTSKIIMSCIECKNIVSGKMSKQGFNACRLGDVFTFYPMHHDCSKFSQMSLDKSEKIAAWVNKNVYRKQL